MSDSEINSESLLVAHDARLKALMECDTGALARVVAEEMQFIGPDGAQRTRADVVASMNAGTLRIEAMDCFDISTRIYGNVGVLLYSANARSSDGVTVFEGQVRCTTVYVWRDRGWQMVSQHQSRLTA